MRHQLAVASILSVLLGTCVIGQVQQTPNPYPERRLLAADRGQIHVLDAAGQSEWSFAAGNLHDLHLLSNGNILAQRGHGEVIEIAPDRKIVWRYDATTMNGNAGKRVEVHAFQRLSNGNTMIAESGIGRIIEVDRDGQIVHQIKLTLDRPNPHRDTRLARKLENGNYLVCHEGDGKVREYDPEGLVVWAYSVPLFEKPRKGGHGPEAFGNEVFGALRLQNGNTLIATGNGHSVLEVTPAKEIVWKVEQNDLKGITLAWVTTLQELPNGNIVLGNCHAGEGQPQVIEIDRKKNVVWSFANWTLLGNATSNSVVLDGPLPGEAKSVARGATWKMVWSDEFEGDAIDRTKWSFDLGNGFADLASDTWISGWGNNELQSYTSDKKNAFVENGALHIRVLKKWDHGCRYTSARLKSRTAEGALFNKTYGRFEFRAKLPVGRGYWPACWLMPQTNTYGGWASSGEIDVVEARGHQPGKIVGALHYGGKWPANTHVANDHVLDDGGSIADFHVYAVEWEPGEIRWFADEHCYATQTFWWSSGKTEGTQGAQPAGASDLNPWPAPFDHPFYLIMNVAIGGVFPGNPDESTPFPAEMVVDYVRVYDRVGGYSKPKPRGKGKLPYGK